MSSTIARGSCTWLSLARLAATPFAATPLAAQHKYEEHMVMVMLMGRALKQPVARYSMSDLPQAQNRGTTAV
jgi:hypothetical protein